MSCGCDTLGGNDSYNNLCNTDTPYPIVSAESVPSLISNLTFALYGQIQKDVSNGKVVWIIPCDPNNTAFIGDVPRLPGEGLMCYFIRYFNTVYPGGVLGIEYGGTGASTAQAALSNLGGVPATRQVITAPSSGLSGGGTLATDRSLSIANTTVVPGTYGANNRIPVLTVNARGQLTGATTVAAEGFASVDGEVITANISQQTVFNLTSIVYSPGTDNLAVYRNGLRLLIGQDYIETNSTTVTLTRGVAIGNQLLFESGRIIGQDVSSVAVATQRIVAADPAPGIQQTVFNLTAITYVPGNNSLAVYRNGLKLDVGADYIETNSATVTLTAGAAAGDQFTFEAGKMLSQPVSATVQTQTITSSLGQTVFALTLSYTPNIGNLAVYKDGLRLISGTDYTETNSDTVTLTTPALAGRQFMFEVGQTLAQPAPVAAASELKTATAGQDEFVLTGLTYVPNTLSLSVYRNGLKLVVGQDYTETDSNTVTLTSPAALGDQLVFEAGRILTNALAGTSVGFQQAGTGAVTRNMQDKAREMVSVKDFGAVGDYNPATGLGTDNTAAIQAAINSLGAAGGTVVLGVGLYKISSEININVEGIKLIGQNKEASTLIQSTASSKILNITSVAKHFELQSVGFDYSVTPVAGATAIYQAGSFCSFSDFLITKCYIGLELNTCVANKVQNFDIRSYSYIGIYVTESNDAFFSNFVLDASTQANGSLGGIRLYNKCEAINFVNGDVIRGVYGLTTDASTYALRARPAACIFTGVFFDSSKTNCAFINNSVDIDFIGCWFSFAGYNDVGPSVPAVGVTLARTDDIRFTGGRVVNCHGAGVNIGALSTNAKFNGFTARDNGLSATGTYAGISVSPGASGFQVVDCTLGGGQNLYSVVTQSYGLEIQAGSSDFYVVKDNLMLGNTLGGMIDGGTGTNKHIAHNIGYQTTVRGLGLIPVGASSANIPHFLSATPANYNIMLSDVQDRAGSGVVRYWVSAVGSTTFTVTTNAVTTSNFFFAWDARIKGA